MTQKRCFCLPTNGVGKGKNCAETIRRLLALFVVLTVAIGGIKATVVNFETKGNDTFSKDGVSLVFNGGKPLTDHYKMPKEECTLTITCPENNIITNIDIKVKKGGLNEGETVEGIPVTSIKYGTTSAKYEVDGRLLIDWTGNTAVLKSDGNKEARVFTVSVTYSNKISLDAVDAPSISPASGEFTTAPSTTINSTASSQDGTSLFTYYTTDGTDPTTSETAVLYNGKFTPTIPDGAEAITVKAATKRVQTDNADNFKWSNEAEATFTMKEKEKETLYRNLALNSKTGTITGNETDGYTATYESGNIKITYKGMNKPGSGTTNFSKDDKISVSSTENIRKIVFSYNKNFNDKQLTTTSSGDLTFDTKGKTATWTPTDGSNIRDVEFTDIHTNNNKANMTSATVYYDGYTLPVAPEITPAEDVVYLDMPQVTVTPSADNTSLAGCTTYYTVDGSDPATSATAKAITDKYSWKPEITISNEVQTYTIKAATKRVVDYKTTLWSDVTSIDLKYGIEDPTISPTEESFDNTSNEAVITIDHEQKAQGVKVYMAYYQGEKKDLTDADYTEIKSLPYSDLKLNKTTTVKMFAEYNGKKTDVITNVYIFLDKNTTYIIPKDQAANITSGTTVEKNGMTMTFGGIITEGGGFKTLNKNYVKELGTTRFVKSETIIIGKKDAESEIGTGDGIKGRYTHPTTSEVLHKKTFGLPARDGFFKFEPDFNGSLTVFVEQQGAIQNSNGKLDPTGVKKRPVYFVDETGTSVPAEYAYTTSRINKSDWEKTKASAVEPDDAGWYTKEYISTLKTFYQNIIDGKDKTFKNLNAAVETDKQHDAVALGEDFQPIIVLHDENNAAKGILANDGIYADGDKNYDNSGYMLIGEGFVTYRFPVKAGKTYYLFGWRTKLGICGFRFQKDNSSIDEAHTVTLNGNQDNTQTIEKMVPGEQYDITLNRSFGAGKWYSVVLPFSVSQKMMKKVFGDDVAVMHFDNITLPKLNLKKHFYQMIVGGTPVLVKPSIDVTNPVFNNVTFISKDITPIEQDGYKCTGSYEDAYMPNFSYFINAKDNTFYQFVNENDATAKMHCGAFRNWIEGATSEAKLTMDIFNIDDSSTTGISNGIITDGVSYTNGIFNLEGQKMQSTDIKSLQRGIYIINGKKIIK